MQTFNPNRRVFLARSATVAAASAGIAGEAQGAAAHPEVKEWTSGIGSRFQVDDETLVLQSVAVTDHSSDEARPRNIRAHSIELLFVRESGKRNRNDAPDLQLNHRAGDILLSRVVAPEGESGVFYEGIIN